MFTIKKGPTLLWSVTTVVQRTNERVAGITGANPVTIEDFYHVAVFEVKVVTNVNLNLIATRIYASLTGAFPTPAFGIPFAAPVLGTSPLLASGQAATAGGNLVVLNNLAANSGAPTIVPPQLILEYDTAAPGATPNLVFEIRAVFYGQPFYQTIP